MPRSSEQTLTPSAPEHADETLSPTDSDAARSYTHPDKPHYDEAFARNIGWVTAAEQRVLATKRIAIAGMGGVGGAHLLTLTRLGIGQFHIADFDAFDIVNFNRQVGASHSTVGKPKVDVMADMALDINPDLKIKRFPTGVTEQNLDRFLEGVDLFVDGLDFFAIDIRRKVFARCAQLRIPAITAAPLGMGCAALTFLPGQMTFEQYFRMEGKSTTEQLVRFLVGLAPARLHSAYLVDPTAVDLVNHKGPSTPMACMMCAGVAATRATKILLKRGKVVAAPRGVHFDAFENRTVITYRPFGNRNPLQWLSIRVAKRIFAGKLEQPETRRPETKYTSVMDRVLDLARWAPSGDNTQPWRFEVKSDQHVVVHGHDTRDHCVYDLDGRASQISLGALLETIKIAASTQGLGTGAVRRLDKPVNEPTFDVSLTPEPAVKPDPLAAFIPLRCTQRRPLTATPLENTERNRMTQAVGQNFEVRFLESPAQRRKVARLLFHSAHIRLTIEEAYRVHKHVIEWGKTFSDDRIPDQAVGLSPFMLAMMKSAMTSWGKVRFMNRFMMGTFLPRIALDYRPGVNCAAHFFLLAKSPPEGIDDQVLAGRALQRFWLTTTSLNLHLQPEMTPLIFSRYAVENLPFTKDARALRRAGDVRKKLNRLIGQDAVDRCVFMGRVGFGTPATSRSLRLPLERLRVKHEPTPGE
ncbi:MAG: thiamine biosynthesis protein ThiF [Phycisphaera sp.]|nr:thiamine biosynthesis protein ThiF [Phycisphaera sp.]